jgi:hypothetical protein
LHALTTGGGDATHTPTTRYYTHNTHEYVRAHNTHADTEHGSFHALITGGGDATVEALVDGVLDLARHLSHHNKPEIGAWQRVVVVCV